MTTAMPSDSAAAIPRDTAPDSTLALLRDGYEFVGKRCRRYRSDAFETRLMLRKAVCATGAEAARMFFEPDRFTRRGALPPTALVLLQDRGSVQWLDGDAHRQRKQMFMSIATPDAAQQLVSTFAAHWRARLPRWTAAGNIVLLPEMEALLCRAACEWAGIPLREKEAARRTREFSAMIDGAGAVGPRNWRALVLRARTERWMRRIVARMRRGAIDAGRSTPAHVVVWHRDADGHELPVRIAAVELINIVRPTVAVARFIVFAALALHEHPQCRAHVAGDDAYLDAFVQEVRRFYPFFPMIGGRVAHAFEWRGHRFAKRTWFLLDLYGTNHDERVWTDANVFRPERFLGRAPGRFDFVPQGGGDPVDGHRCPGEAMTVALVKTAVRLLTTEMRYDVPPQDLTVELSRMPAQPRSRFVIHVQ